MPRIRTLKSFYRYIEKLRVSNQFIHENRKGHFFYLLDRLGHYTTDSQLDYENMWLKNILIPWLGGLSFQGIHLLSVLQTHIWNAVLVRTWLRFRLSHQSINQFTARCDLHTRTSQDVKYCYKTLHWVSLLVRWVSALFRISVFAFGMLSGILVNTFKGFLDKLYNLPVFSSDRQEILKFFKCNKVVLSPSPTQVKRAFEWIQGESSRSPLVVIIPSLSTSAWHIRKVVSELDQAGIVSVVCRVGHGIKVFRTLREFLSFSFVLCRRLNAVIHHFWTLGGRNEDLFRMGVLLGGQVGLGFASANMLVEILGGEKWHFTSAQSGMCNALIYFIRKRGGWTSHQLHGAIGAILPYRTCVDENHAWGEWDAHLMRKYGWDRKVLVNTPSFLQGLSKKSSVNFGNGEIQVLVASNLLMCAAFHPDPFESLALGYAWEFFKVVAEWIAKVAVDWQVLIGWKPHPRESLFMYKKLLDEVIEKKLFQKQKVNWKWLSSIDDPIARSSPIAICSVSSIAIELIAQNKAVFIYDRVPYDKETYISCFSERRKFRDSDELYMRFQQWVKEGCELRTEAETLNTFLKGKHAKN